MQVDVSFCCCCCIFLEQLVSTKKSCSTKTNVSFTICFSMICHLSAKYVSAVGYFVLHLWTSEKSPKQAAAAAVVDSGGVFIFLTCMGNPGSWEVKSWNGKIVGLLRLVKVFFCYQTRVFSCICHWIIFGNRNILDGVVWYVNYPTNGWSQKKDPIFIYIYILIFNFEMVYIGEGHPRRISSKDTLCFIGPSTGLESGVKYAEVPSTSSLRCCLTATITSRRGWWGP